MKDFCWTAVVFCGLAAMLVFIRECTDPPVASARRSYDDVVSKAYKHCRHNTICKIAGGNVGIQAVCLQSCMDFYLGGVDK